MIGVLFVCLGNICRSPLAEEVFRQIVKEQNCASEFFVDSCGTAAYHIGESPDARMVKTAKKHNLVLLHKGRQFLRADFSQFDYILAMDTSNYKDILNLTVDLKEEKKVHLLRDFDDDEESPSVPDPYYGGDQGFEEVYQIVKRCCENLFRFIQNENR